MALQETLTADLKTAMLSRDSFTVSVLRLLQSALKYVEIEVGHPLSDEEIVQIIRKEVKRRKETAITYRSVQQEERAANEEQEVAVLEKYLPAALDPAIIRSFIEEKAATLGTLEARHKGELIKAAMQQFAGQVDGKVVSDIVNSLY